MEAIKLIKKKKEKVNVSKLLLLVLLFPRNLNELVTPKMRSNDEEYKEVNILGSCL